MNDLMVDIETLGSGSNALILQVGACYFNRLTGEVGDKFCHSVSIQDSLDWDFSVDGSTIEFWLKQVNRSFLVDPLLIEEVLKLFSQFAKTAESAWAHATFDFPILADAYKKLGLRLPFPYWITRDIRTLVDLSGVPVPKTVKDKSHDALEDCIYQVGYCTKCFQAIRLEDLGT